MSVGERAFKGTEAEALEIRKRMYATNTHFGNPHVWMTFTPDDLMDPIAAAYAGFVPTIATADMNNEEREFLATENKDHMAAVIAANPVACAIAFREQLTIFIEEVLGWNLSKSMGLNRVMTPVIAFDLQARNDDLPPPHIYWHAHGVYMIYGMMLTYHVHSLSCYYYYIRGLYFCIVRAIGGGTRAQ